ncbi:ATP-binding protein [Siminovitchia terrae]|nr:MoxR family ATPase [Siminovitchia terrae]RST57963.1 MoxR family ATPase [Siminovitchia terrae]
MIEKRKRAFSYYHEELIGEHRFLSEDQTIFQDAVIALSLGKNILLKGPTGSGKTRLAESLSSFFGQPMHSVNCSVDTDMEALLGFKTITQNDGASRIDFIQGPVIKAMEKGHFLYIDEINMAKPETLPLLNSILDYRRMLTNPLTTDVIQAKETFGVIAAINEGYVGTVPMNEALKNRFIVIDIPYVQGEILKDVIKQESKLHDEKMIEQFVRLSSDLLVQVKSGIIPEEAASIRALIDTCDLAVYMDPLRAVRRGISDKLEEEREKAAVVNIASTLFK